MFSVQELIFNSQFTWNSVGLSEIEKLMQLNMLKVMQL